MTAERTHDPASSSTGSSDGTEPKARGSSDGTEPTARSSSYGTEPAARGPSDGTAMGSGAARRGLREALDDEGVASVARAMRNERRRDLGALVALGHAVARAVGDAPTAERLSAELEGYGESELAVPEVRRATGFASAFPVRALDLGLLDPEEIFSAHNEKFSQVTLTIGQPVGELVQALAQIREGGVLALKVPASEVTGRSAETSSDTEVYIYILPGEIQRIVDEARALAIDVLVSQVVEAACTPAD